MLHIQVPVCFTYHLHVSMPVARGSTSAVDYSCAPVAKETPECLCSCTPSDGIHVQVTSHGGGLITCFAEEITAHTLGLFHLTTQP